MNSSGGLRSGRRTVVVTGGSAGVGRATVREFARRGCDVAVLARGEDGLRAAVAEVRAAGARGIAVPTDVADHHAVEQAAESVEAELGPIDVWVNNAFTGAIAFFDEITPKEYERITAVTYLGYVNGTRAALARMTPRRRGVIIQVGSSLGYRGIPLQSAYCGAKHAIVGFTESVRVELMHKKLPIQLCEVHVPATNTPQFDWVLHRGIRHHPQPVPPMFQPEVAARAVAHMAEHPRRTMWVGWPTAVTIIGNRLAPGLIDRYLARSNVEAQQAPEHGPPTPQVNTWQPVPGDAGAHGAFDDKARGRSVQAWLSRHRTAAIATSLATAAAAGMAWRQRRGSIEARSRI